MSTNNKSYRDLGTTVKWYSTNGENHSGTIISRYEDIYIVKCDDGINRAVSEFYLNKHKITDDWEREANSELIGNDSNNLYELEKEKSKYDIMHHKQRRVADWKSMELFDKTNTERYNELKSKYLKDVDNFKNEYDNIEISAESSISSTGEDISNKDEYHTLQDKPNYENPEYDEKVLRAAIEWSNNSMITIILPTKTLDELEKSYEKWKSMVRKHQRNSDDKSIELFGMNNTDHYNYLKNKFMGLDDDKYDTNTIGLFSAKSDQIEKIKKELSVEKIEDEEPSNLKYASSLMKLNNIKTDDTYSSILKESVIKEIKNKLENSYDKTYKYLPTQLPYFSFKEIESLASDMSNLYRYEGLSENISLKKWLDSYHLLCEGIIDSDMNEYIPLWINKVNELCIKLYKEKDENKIHHLKENILLLGWNPEIHFTHENRIKATNRCLRIISESYKNNISDLTSLVENVNDNHIDILTESSNDKDLYPVFIVLSYTNTSFGKIITKVTNSIYSHAALSLDSSLERLYSFNAGVNGFSLESITGYKKKYDDSIIQVSCVFVKRSDLSIIQNKLNDLLANIKNTSYSFLNILGLAINKPIQMNYSMICSQFVDYIFKSIGADITNKPSGLVIPKDFQILKNNRVYKLYEGKIVNYSQSKIDRTIRALTKKAVYVKENFNIINESSFIDVLYENINDIDTLILLSEKSDILDNKNKDIYESYIRPYIDINYIIEAKEFPVQFDNEGNLLIKNKKNIDFEIEYSKSHKLLKIYEDTDNIEGMKYELSKLWFLNLLLEEKIYVQKHKKSDQYLKVRARILNDFTKYLKIVNNKDKDFNFTEYYNNTPFSDETVKINKSTLKYAGELLKDIIKNLVK